MAIFTKPNQQADYSSNVTTISAGTTVTGKIDIQCELNIDGEIKAEIFSTGAVKIGQTGSVEGNLAAKSLIVAGRFTGDADCDTIELIAGGQVEGRLISQSLIIDASSSFQGKVFARNPTARLRGRLSIWPLTPHRKRLILRTPEIHSGSGRGGKFPYGRSCSPTARPS